jgi:hypothetical protein
MIRGDCGMSDMRHEGPKKKLAPKWEAWEGIEEARGPWWAALLKLLFKRDVKQIGFLVALAGIILVGIDLARNGGSLAAILVVVFVLAALALVALWKGDRDRAASAKDGADDQNQPGGH